MNEPAPKKRRINGLVIVAAAFLVLLFLNYRPTVARVHCDDEILSRSPEVIMLSTWWCPYCNQARRYFTDNDISYCEYDIETSVEGERRYDRVGGRGIPVIIMGDYMMNGFDERQFEKLRQHARPAGSSNGSEQAI